MKVLILANNDIGLYKFRKELIERLLVHHQVYICLPNGEFVSLLKKMGCYFVSCELERHGMNPFKEIKLFAYYTKILKKIKPDITFTYTIKTNVWGGMACSFLNIPYVANITGLGSAVETSGMLQKITLLLYKFGLRKAQNVFFQNQENQNFMITRHIITGRYDLLPGSGVNLKQYIVLDFPKDDCINFSFIARIMKQKGIEQFLEAAEYIKSKYPKTNFHVCGECEENYKDRLIELQNKKIIIYHGLVKDIVAIHRNSHCTVLPTYYPEGLSNVLLESVACGRPIITTNRSGCREIVDDCINGYIVKPKDSKDLIDKIEKFIHLSFSEKRKMGLNGRIKVEKNFNREVVIEKYLKELDQVK